jgi:outer membrane protein insertion porin family
VSIRVEGTQRTRSAFLDTLVRPFLDPSHAPGLPPFSAANRTLFATTPDTFGGALQTAQLAVAQLTRTDVFARVEPRLQASRGVFARPGDLELVLRATERGWLRAKTSTEVGAGEGTAVRTPAACVWPGR